MSISDSRNLYLCRLSYIRDLMTAGKTEPGGPAGFLPAAAFCSFMILWGLLPVGVHAASPKGEQSEAPPISITDAYVEPSEKPVRRGSAIIKVAVDAGVVTLHSIKCDDGSIAHVYFPPRRGEDRVSGLINHDLRIRPPGLELTPGVGFSMSRPPEYIDNGHLVFTGGTQSGRNKNKSLLCKFDFGDTGVLSVPFSTINLIEDLRSF